MKIVLLLHILLIIAALQVSAKGTKNHSNTREKIFLNGIWKFKYFPAQKIDGDSLFFLDDFDDKDWSDIKVPGHWDLQGFAEPGVKDVSPGTGLYRTSFRLPPDMKGKQIFIRFEGVQYGYDFYVNGKYVASWASSYNSADFNITQWVDFSDVNCLAVKVSNRVKGYEFDMNDCWKLSGIYRDVIIYSTSGFHIGDYSVQTQLLNNNSEASINVTIGLKNSQREGFSGISLKSILHSPDGSQTENLISSLTSLDCTGSFKVKNPELWSAETPVLYDLELLLYKGDKIIDCIKQPVGIRQMSIENSVLKLNGSPLKLRGVDHHDLVPETGRTLSRNDILSDLRLIQQANINFIRTSHYPPDRRMLDMCDSLGIYVMCEVPFGYGDIHLIDTTYLGNLLNRANATILRDRNHPCVIIWSIGNENPLTSITETVGKFVKNTDPSRPICYPQMGSYFKGNYKWFPDFIDIYSPHYVDAVWVSKFQKETTKPVILTEYAHALGLSFGNMEDIWRELFHNDRFAGGAVWHFQDQGIVRKAPKPVDRSLPTVYVWKDSVTYYDTRKYDGTDGIVYSDRTPQTDYWQVKKVYSPVQIIETKLPVIAGNQLIRFAVYNQYDFLNLSVLQAKWTLYRNSKIKDTGNLVVNCAPHDTVFQEIPLVLTANPETDVWYLKLDFQDKNGLKIYSHSIELITGRRYSAVQNQIVRREEIPLTVERNAQGSAVVCRDFTYGFIKKDFSVKLMDNSNVKKSIVGGLLARTGRILKISDSTYISEEVNKFWEPHLIQASHLKNLTELITENLYKLSVTADFLRGNEFPEQMLVGDISYQVENNGIMTVSYQMRPENANGIFLETGVSLVLSEEITDFTWLGNGPYSSYPDKHLLNDFGIYSVKKGDINFNGNRSNVDIAVLSDSKGNGIAVLGDHSDISVEIMSNRIIVSHNAGVMGVGNKGARAQKVLSGGTLKSFRGEFRIVPLRAGEWPDKLVELFGYPSPSLKPFNPFYHSYDFTW